MQASIDSFSNLDTGTDVASPDKLSDVARLHMEAGNVPAAAAAWQRVLEMRPRHAEALHGLALIAFQAHEFPIAQDLARKAAGANTREPAYFNTLGRALAASGKYDEAVKAYRKAITLDAGLADVHVSLGIAYKHMGKLDDAILSQRRALRINPKSWVALHNLANALVARGEIAQAREAFEKVLAVNPASGEAQFELANLLRKSGEREAARLGYLRAFELGMRSSQNWIALGEALSAHAEAKSALECFRKAAQAEPTNVAAQYRLAGALYDLRDFDGAIEAFSRALTIDGASAEGLVNLGIALRDRGRREEAIACFQRALQTKPELAEAYLNLGIALNDYEQYAAAEKAFSEAMRLSPSMAEAHLNLGFTRRSLTDYSAAISLTHHALTLAPDSAQGYNNFGLLEVEVGNAQAGIPHYLKALSLRPEYLHSRSNLLMAMNYANAQADAVVQAHREFGILHAAGLQEALPVRRRGVSKLRIGYVSADFRRHSVAHFVEPVLARHDKTRFEVVCYYNHLRGDDLTERLKGYADQWVESSALSDVELYARVRADGIDILIDLGGHTAGNRLLCFARKPAPVQMTWLGYPSTTGVAQIDYRITDWQVDPQGYERFNIEKPLRLPSSYFCYRPPQVSPPVAELPASSNGHITFGSFNNLAKLSEATVALWSKVLDAAPGSKLLMKTKALADEGVRRRVLKRFAEQGVEAGRLDLVGWEIQTQSHLAIYNRVDIALDTWPYNGATTTCEALWMGVPVVTLCGTTHAARMGKSILLAAGLAGFVADSDLDYVRICASLAANPASLGALRSQLRAALRNSPLMDEAVFTAEYENALRRVWHQGTAA
jgi:protein O-GlcNAc transferase